MNNVPRKRLYLDVDEDVIDLLLDGDISFN